MAYTWSADLETGSVVIDSQHKELINAINKLMEACSVGQGRAQLKDTAQFLLNYTKKHFADEEALQQKYGYPDYVNHKGYHGAFIKVVQELAADLDANGPTIASVARINTAVGGWLLDHIKREDVKVAKHIKSKS